MLISPIPATPDNFFLNYNAGSTMFNASEIFSTPAGDEPEVDGLPGTENGWILRWEATSTGSIPAHPAFVSNATVSSVTVSNADWGFDSTCVIRVTAISITGYPSVSYEIRFFVSDV